MVCRANSKRSSGADDPPPVCVMANKTEAAGGGSLESVLALVHYYAREGYWHHVQTVADQVIQKRGRAPILSFWKAYSICREGEFAKAIRDLDRLKTKREVCYETNHLASIVTHPRSLPRENFHRQPLPTRLLHSHQGRLL